MKIHNDQSGHHRISGTYAHGLLETDMGFDIFEISDHPFELDPNSNTDYRLKPKSGVYNCTYQGKDCVFFLWNRHTGLIWGGLVVYSEDISSLKYAIEMYEQRSITI